MPRPPASRVHLAALAALAVALAACGAHSDFIPGTRVKATSTNEALVQRIEAYRMAVERKDSAALVLMASKDYWDDAGTPTGEDDYGYAGLKEILAGRFQRAVEVRYALKYMAIQHRGNRAFVDVLVDASFSVEDGRGEDQRQDLRDQNQFVLEWDGENWMFISGM